MYQYSILKNPDEKQILHILNLYKAANWWEEDGNETDIIDKIISGSYIFMIVAYQDKIIGMGRVISDGVSDAYIQDVTVDKDYRNRKIGSSIVSLLINNLEKDGIKWIGLIAENNSQKFYTPMGFVTMKNASPMLKILK